METEPKSFQAHGNRIQVFPDLWKQNSGLSRLMETEPRSFQAHGNKTQVFPDLWKQNSSLSRLMETEPRSFQAHGNRAQVFPGSWKQSPGLCRPMETKLRSFQACGNRAQVFPGLWKVLVLDLYHKFWRSFKFHCLRSLDNFYPVRFKLADSCIMDTILQSAFWVILVCIYMKTIDAFLPLKTYC